VRRTVYRQAEVRRLRRRELVPKVMVTERGCGRPAPLPREERGERERFSDRVVEMPLTVDPEEDGGEI
jgi:hypothetical protein